MKRLTPDTATVTGKTEATDDAAAPKLEDVPRRDRPFVVFVRTDPDACDGNCKGACARYFEADQQVFENERVLLATNAFHLLWMTPEDAADEALLGTLARSEIPRIVLVDPVRKESTVLHGGRLRASQTFTAMEKVVSRFYAAKLDDLVRLHLRFLIEHDELARQVDRLKDQIARSDVERKTSELKQRLEVLVGQQRALDKKIELLWALTPKPL